MAGSTRLTAGKEDPRFVPQRVKKELDFGNKGKQSGGEGERVVVFVQTETPQARDCGKFYMFEGRFLGVEERE